MQGGNMSVFPRDIVGARDAGAARPVANFGLAAIGAGLLLLAAISAAAQGITGTVSGTVTDQQGGVMPGATVTLVSETKGTRTAPVVTNPEGAFVVPNVPADRYTVQVEMPSFKTLSRTGIAVSNGSQVAVGKLGLEIGSLGGNGTVTSEAPLLQTASGDRASVIDTLDAQNLPLSGRT